VRGLTGVLSLFEPITVLLSLLVASLLRVVLADLELNSLLRSSRRLGKIHCRV
jgi:hypothetical protein